MLSDIIHLFHIHLLHSWTCLGCSHSYCMHSTHRYTYLPTPTLFLITFASQRKFSAKTSNCFLPVLLQIAMSTSHNVDIHQMMYLLAYRSAILLNSYALNLYYFIGIIIKLCFFFCFLLLSSRSKSKSCSKGEAGIMTDNVLYESR